jgi:hypothetical protein
MRLGYARSTSAICIAPRGPAAAKSRQPLAAHLSQSLDTPLPVRACLLDELESLENTQRVSSARQIGACPAANRALPPSCRASSPPGLYLTAYS